MESGEFGVECTRREGEKGVNGCCERSGGHRRGSAWWSDQRSQKGLGCGDISVRIVKRGWCDVASGPREVVATQTVIRAQEKAEATDGVVNSGKVVGDSFRGEDVVAILTIGKVVIRKICARENHFIIGAIQLHVLQSPALVDALRDIFLAETGEIRRVVHADLNLIRKLSNERRKK